MNFVNAQIFIMAAFAFIIAAGGIGVLLTRIGIPDRKLLYIMAGMLPFSAVTNLLIKSPVNLWIVAKFKLDTGFTINQPILYLVFLAFLPPLTEEFVKLFPYLVPKIKQRTITDGLWVGAWSGLGFGLGELLYLAWGVAGASQYQGLPWFAFTGFLGERITVCLIHAILTAISFYYLGLGRGLIGYGIAVLLHFGVNIGAVLLALHIIKPWLTNVLLAGMLIIIVMLFEYLRKQWMNNQVVLDISKEIIHFQRN